MAERLSAAAAAEIPNFQATSAGTQAVIGHGIHHEAARVLDQLGGDASNFAARQLSSKIASAANLIITMTVAHRDAVLELAPHKLHRTFTLSEAARLSSEFNAQTVGDLASLRPLLSAQERFDIPDPIGHDAETFAAVGSQIADLLVPVVDLCRRSSVSSAD